MPAGKFSLGGLAFDALAFEVPEDLEFALRTLGSVTDLPQTDGMPAQRVGQTAGVVPDTITFTATFLGVNAESKAQQLETMQRQGGAYPFARGSRSFAVQIMAVRLKYRSDLEIGYSVTLEPLIEYTAVGSSTSGSSASTQLDANLAAVQSLTLTPSQANTSTGATGDTDESVLMQLANQTALNDDETMPAAQAAIDAAIAGIVALDIAEATVAQFQALADTLALAQAAVQSALAAHVNATDAEGVAAYLIALDALGTINVAIATLGLFTGSVAAATVSPNGMNAYEIAAFYTGDVSNVDPIMQANNIADPFDLGSTPVVIPAGLTAA